MTPGFTEHLATGGSKVGFRFTILNLRIRHAKNLQLRLSGAVMSSMEAPMPGLVGTTTGMARNFSGAAEKEHIVLRGLVVRLQSVCKLHYRKMNSTLDHRGSTL
jgi:hypothetical protein